MPAIRTVGPAGRLVITPTDPATIPPEKATQYRDVRLTAKDAWTAAANLFGQWHGDSADRGGELVDKERNWWKPYGRQYRGVYEFKNEGPAEFDGYFLWSVWPVGKVTEWHWQADDNKVTS